MATLHVRNFPDTLHRRLRQRATERGRSLSAELVNIVAEVMHDQDSREAQAALLAEVRRRSEKRRRLKTSIVASLRKDRAR